MGVVNGRGGRVAATAAAAATNPIHNSPLGVVRLLLTGLSLRHLHICELQRCVFAELRGDGDSAEGPQVRSSDEALAEGRRGEHHNRRRVVTVRLQLLCSVRRLANHSAAKATRKKAVRNIC